MQSYLCSSASQCPGKGPPQLNICTSTRLITHNTLAQPLSSLSPPQRLLEKRRKRWEECNPPVGTLLFLFPRLIFLVSVMISHNVWLYIVCVLVYFYIAVLPLLPRWFILLIRKHFLSKEVYFLSLSCLFILLSTLFSYLTFVIYLFIYFPTSIDLKTKNN